MAKTKRQLDREIAAALERRAKSIKSLPGLRKWNARSHKSYDFQTPAGQYEITRVGTRGDYHLTFDAVPVFGGLLHELGTHTTAEVAAIAAAKHYAETF